MSGEPATTVENGVSTRKVRDLLTVNLTFCTSLISLMIAPPPAPRSAAPVRSAEQSHVSAAPKIITPKASNFRPDFRETRTPLIPFPLCRRLALATSPADTPKLDDESPKSR